MVLLPLNIKTESQFRLVKHSLTVYCMYGVCECDLPPPLHADPGDLWLNFGSSVPAILVRHPITRPPPHH